MHNHIEATMLGKRKRQPRVLRTTGGTEYLSGVPFITPGGWPFGGWVPGGSWNHLEHPRTFDGIPYTNAAADPSGTMWGPEHGDYGPLSARYVNPAWIKLNWLRHNLDTGEPDVSMWVTLVKTSNVEYF